jgi:hypothetical protein
VCNKISEKFGKIGVSKREGKEMVAISPLSPLVEARLLDFFPKSNSNFPKRKNGGELEG